MHALYKWFDFEGQLLYVGMSHSLWNRTKQHQKTAKWFSEISFCTVTWYETRAQVGTAEDAAISKLNPIHNRTPNKNPNGSPQFVNPPGSKNHPQLKKEIARLENEIEYLHYLADTQEKLIRSLEEKIKTYKPHRIFVAS